jgi:putative membrane protein
MPRHALALAPAAGALAGLVLAACSPAETGGAPDQQNEAVNTVQDHAAGVVGAAAGPAGAATDPAFVTNAAVGGLYEVEAGRIAIQRSTNRDVKALAQMLVNDHTRAADKLKPISARLNLTVPTALDQRHQGLIDNLRGASDQDFDRVFLQQQESAHNEAAALLSTYQQIGGQAELKAWAAETLPRIQAHQAHIDKLDEANVDAAR